jgi:flagellar biosynthetic protein FliQ
MTAAIVGLVREGMLLVLLLAAPLLAGALIAGIVSSLLAAFTQLHDPAVALVPRVVAVGAAVVLFAPSIGRQVDALALRLWPLIVAVGKG